MPEDYLLVLIRRAAQVVAAILLGRKDDSPEALALALQDDFRLSSGLDLNTLLRRTPEDLVTLLASGGDALFAERGLILAATLARLAYLQSGQPALVSALQCRALIAALRARFGADATNPLSESLAQIEAAL